MSCRLPNGIPIHQAHPDYLQWVLTTEVDRTLKYRIRKHLGLVTPRVARKGKDTRASLKQAYAQGYAHGYQAGLAASRGVIKKWRRELAKEYHPDRRNGSEDAMIAINDGCDKILKDFD